MGLQTGPKVIYWIRAINTVLYSPLGCLQYHTQESDIRRLVLVGCRSFLIPCVHTEQHAILNICVLCSFHYIIQLPSVQLFFGAYLHNILCKFIIPDPKNTRYCVCGASWYILPQELLFVKKKVSWTLIQLTKLKA